MGTRIVAAQVALTGIDKSDPAPAAGLDRDRRTIGVTPPGWVHGADEQPVALLGRDIAIKPRRSRDRGYKQVHRAIVVHIAATQAARDAERLAKRVRGRQVAKSSRAIV